MGGKALKECETRRYQRDEYFRLESEVCGKLRKYFPAKVVIMPIASYGQKESFGDMDIIVSSEALPISWREDVAILLESKEVVRNGPDTSFEHREFQIDIKAVPLAEFETSWRYFAYNDLGNLLGRVAHRMGLKLGHKGLFYTWKTGTEVHDTYCLSTDWKEILEIIGYDPDVYYTGFVELEDIFKFVASGSFFRPAIYDLANTNHANRMRDAKRPTYTTFLKWLESDTKTYSPEWTREEYFRYLTTRMPVLKAKDEEVWKAVEDKKKFKAVFNGGTVGLATGLTNKALGDFMRWLHEQHPNLQQRIIVMNPVVVPRWIKFRYDQYRGEESSACCENENRSMAGGCLNCGDPSY